MTTPIVGKTFPLRAPANRIDRGSLTFTAPVGSPDSYVVQIGNNYNQAWGGIVPRFGPYPLVAADLEHMPLVMGWPGQFLYDYADPALDAALSLPTRPMAGDRISGIAACYEPAAYFARKGYPIRLPNLVCSNEQVSWFHGGVSGGTSILSMSAIGALIAQGVNVATINDGTFFAGNRGPLLQFFPLGPTIAIPAVDPGVFPFGVDASGNQFRDWTIDPTSFIGGKVLLVNFQPTLPLTGYNISTTPPPPPVAGFPISQSSTSFGGVPYFLWTIVAQAVADNRMLQITNAIASLTKFKQVIVYDPATQFTAPDGSFLPYSTFPAWDSIVGTLSAPWLELVAANLGDPSTMDSVIAAQAAAFFA